MRSFMDKDFLLDSAVARELYHDHAASCPIIDYHNHLSPKDMATGRRFQNLTQLWLEGDHYKWRAMRAQGVDESLITGNSTDWQKFQAWAAVVPRLVGSPLHHWTHLELQRYFQIHQTLTPATAEEIWERTREKLSQPDYEPLGLLKKMNVLALCTTDDPVDSLQWHQGLAENGNQQLSSITSVRVLPTFRPDRFLSIAEPGWREVLKELEQTCGIQIASYHHLQEALVRRLDFFYSLGCRVTDHGLSQLCLEEGNGEQVFERAMDGASLSGKEVAVFQNSLLTFLCSHYHRRDMAMQLHIGPLRNQSPRLLALLGRDAGGDTIGRPVDSWQLGRFLGQLEASNILPKTILYNMNPTDNAMLSTMAATFAPRVQFGAAWWLNDHLRGIRSQLWELMETGQLASSVGMLTDSRSFTSFVRHEYFRRILCNVLGKLVEEGLYPWEREVLGNLVEAICWKNCRDFLGI